jgi:hypothetical protein
MTNQHPITPPPKLVKQLFDGNGTYADDICQAAQWGSDQELEACVALVNDWAQRLGYPHYGAELRAARRLKPPTLKEQALNCLADIEHGATPCPSDFDSIRRALEALPE